MQKWLFGRVHISWHIAWIALGCVVGIALARYFPTRYSLIFMISACVGCIIVCTWRTRILVILGVVAGLCFGLARASVLQLALQDYVTLYGHISQVRGLVSEDPVLGKHGDQRLHLAHVYVGKQSLPGELWISLQSKIDVKRGDIVIVEGVVEKGFGTFAAVVPKGRIIKAERPHMGDVARVARDWFAAGIRLAIPNPEASLGIGYLTGQRSSLPISLDEQLRTVGLTHAVVASGYNLTILVGFARSAFHKISKYLSTVSAGAMICAFMCVTGFSPSMSRAGLVAGISLWTWYYGRTIHPVILLVIAAAGTALLKPSYVWGDLGWYLSFTAFAGVMVLAPLVRRYLWGAEQSPGAFWQIMTDTMCAQLLTMPIILYAFGTFTTYALLANVVILPFVPLAMLLVFVAGLGGLAAPGLASYVGSPAWALLHYMIAMVQRIAEWPNATKEIAFTPVMLAAAYVGIVLFIIILWRKTGHNFRAL